MRFAKAYLEITDVCNLNCSFCAGTVRKKEFISCEDFRLYAEKLKPYTDFLYLHVLGEPLLHPKFKEILSIAKNLGFKIIITTNGTLLNEKGQAILDNDAVFKVSISLHSFEANDNGNFNLYLASCLDFCDKASKKGIISVMRLWNMDSEKRYGKILLNDSIEKAIHDYFPVGEWEINTRGIRIRKKLFIEYGERFEWCEDGEEEKIHCYGLSDQIGVLCDGTVIPCCIDCDGKISLGNLKYDTMEDILSSDKAKKLTEGFNKSTAVFDLCKHCGFARTRL